VRKVRCHESHVRDEHGVEGVRCDKAAPFEGGSDGGNDRRGGRYLFLPILTACYRDRLQEFNADPFEAVLGRRALQ
jgi:hypothetical protein